MSVSTMTHVNSKFIVWIIQSYIQVIFFIFHGLPIFGNFAKECSFCVPCMWISMNVHIQSEWEVFWERQWNAQTKVWCKQASKGWRCSCWFVEASSPCKDLGWQLVGSLEGFFNFNISQGEMVCGLNLCVKLFGLVWRGMFRGFFFCFGKGK